METRPLISVVDDDGGTGTASVRVVAAARGEAFGLQATGLIKIPATPQVSCPPDQAKSAVDLRTALVSVHGLAASCRVDPATGVTTAVASVGTITALGVIHISGVDSTCVSSADGLSGNSRVGSINGRPIGSRSGSVGIPGVAQVFYNEDDVRRVTESYPVTSWTGERVAHGWLARAEAAMTEAATTPGTPHGDLYGEALQKREFVYAAYNKGDWTETVRLARQSLALCEQLRTARLRGHNDPDPE